MGRVLNSTDQAWCDDLLLRLRMRDVPGARIGEVLAEVQSHVAETGEHPREAFGAPKEYADQVADALGAPRPGWRAAVRGLTWLARGRGASLGTAKLMIRAGTRKLARAGSNSRGKFVSSTRSFCQSMRLV